MDADGDGPVGIDPELAEDEHSATVVQRILTFSATPSDHATGGRPEAASSPPVLRKRSIAKLQVSVQRSVATAGTGAWELVCLRLNAMLRGWQNYFYYGSVQRLLKVSRYIADRARYFLQRRHHGTPSRGYRQFPERAVFEEPGIHAAAREQDIGSSSPDSSGCGDSPLATYESIAAGGVCNYRRTFRHIEGARVEVRLEGLLGQAAKNEPSYADFLDELLS